VLCCRKVEVIVVKWWDVALERVGDGWSGESRMDGGMDGWMFQVFGSWLVFRKMHYH
jgi:hypothetical protein